jgi:DNA-binding response OmpR family regulator
MTGTGWPMFRPTVLLVEEDDDLRVLFKSALVFAGFAVADAPGGLEALRYLETNRPDVVLLDLMMPGISGFDVRAELRTKAHLRHVPVVVVTAIPIEDLQGYDARCILTKPVMPADVVVAVRGCLRGSAATSGGNTPPAP